MKMTCIKIELDLDDKEADVYTYTFGVKVEKSEEWRRTHYSCYGQSLQTKSEFKDSYLLGKEYDVDVVYRNSR